MVVDPESELLLFKADFGREALTSAAAFIPGAGVTAGADASGTLFLADVKKLLIVLMPLAGDDFASFLAPFYAVESKLVNKEEAS